MHMHLKSIWLWVFVFLPCFWGNIIQIKIHFQTNRKQGLSHASNCLWTHVRGLRNLEWITFRTTWANKTAIYYNNKKLIDSIYANLSLSLCSFLCRIISVAQKLVISVKAHIKMYVHALLQWYFCVFFFIIYSVDTKMANIEYLCVCVKSCGAALFGKLDSL